jgi:hypothetical protein
LALISGRAQAGPHASGNFTMSLFGKILAILNIFAVIGVVAVMGMEYGKRHAWQYAAYREELMLKGLPLGPDETDKLQQKRANLIDEQTKKDLFGGVEPVTTQEGEVQRVKDLLYKNKIQPIESDQKKQLVAYARILMPMVVNRDQMEQMLAYQIFLQNDQTYQQLLTRLTQTKTIAQQLVKDGKAKTFEQAFHEVLAGQFADPPGILGDEVLEILKAEPNTTVDKALDTSLDKQLAEIKSQYDQMFRDAMPSGETAAAKQGSNLQRRRVIARLLFNMVEPLLEGDAAKNLDLMGNPAYKRFIMVVGVEAAVEAVNDQAAILQEIANEIDLQRDRERGLFSVEHRKELDVVLEKKDEVEKNNILLTVKEKQLATHEETLKKRRLDIQFYQNQLMTARQQTAQHLKELRTMSEALHQERIKLRDKTENNQKLEKEIRTLETGK